MRETMLQAENGQVYGVSSAEPIQAGEPMHWQVKALVDWFELVACEDHTSPVERLEALALLQRELEHRIRIAARQARSEGSSWFEVGSALGVTRQAAQQRFGE